jgi:hypothetical protein
MVKPFLLDVLNKDLLIGIIPLRYLLGLNGYKHF